jgi:hypothetical protein
VSAGAIAFVLAFSAASPARAGQPGAGPSGAPATAPAPTATAQPADAAHSAKARTDKKTDEDPRGLTFQTAVGAAGAASSWQGDGAAYGSLKLGLRFADLVSIHYLGKLGYGGVDTRMLTFLSLGAQVWGRIGTLRPYARIAAVHQHEEPVQAIEDDRWGALFGVGDGIRHRMGGEGGLGVDIPLYRRKAVELFSSVEGSIDWFPDPRGPEWYGGGGVAIGVNYIL